MGVKGVVKNGVVVLNGKKKLPDGVHVDVDMVKNPILGPALLKFAGTMKGYPKDFSRNHDHYIRGKPKK